MTDFLFFDTDCLSAFLWTRNENLLPQLYPGRIVIPRPVYTELCRPQTLHLKNRVDSLLTGKHAAIQDIAIDTEEYHAYFQLTELPAKGYKVIGNGEAASIALAKKHAGIVASNNLRDIQIYISKFGLKHTTTSDILVDAYSKNLISEQDGNTIWHNMLAKRRRLGAASFTEYLNQLP